MKVLSLAEFRAKALHPIEVPSQTNGAKVVVKVRKIARHELLSLIPTIPPGADRWTKENAVAKAQEFLDSLTPEKLEERKALGRDISYRICALAVVEPKGFTVDDARAMAGEAVDIAVEVLRISGLETKVDEEPAEKTEPTAETESVTLG